MTAGCMIPSVVGVMRFTHSIKDCWMHDHECGWGGESMVKKLGQMWKKILSKSDADLGIDTEFTCSGVVCFLEGFKKMVEEIETHDEPAVKFPSLHENKISGKEYSLSTLYVYYPSSSLSSSSSYTLPFCVHINNI